MTIYHINKLKSYDYIVVDKVFYMLQHIFMMKSLKN